MAKQWPYYEERDDTKMNAVPPPPLFPAPVSTQGAPAARSAVPAEQQFGAMAQPGYFNPGPVMRLGQYIADLYREGQGLPPRNAAPAVAPPRSPQELQVDAINNGKKSGPLGSTGVARPGLAPTVATAPVANSSAEPVTPAKAPRARSRVQQLIAAEGQGAAPQPQQPPPEALAARDYLSKSPIQSYSYGPGENGYVQIFHMRDGTQRSLPAGATLDGDLKAWMDASNAAYKGEQPQPVRVIQGQQAAYDESGKRTRSPTINEGFDLPQAGGGYLSAPQEIVAGGQVPQYIAALAEGAKTRADPTQVKLREQALQNEGQAEQSRISAGPGFASAAAAAVNARANADQVAAQGKQQEFERSRPVIIDSRVEHDPLTGAMRTVNVYGTPDGKGGWVPVNAGAQAGAQPVAPAPLKPPAEAILRLKKNRNNPDFLRDFEAQYKVKAADYLK